MMTLDFLLPVSLSNKIRVGPNCDGGYVVYKPSFDEVDLLLTYGVGWDINFEIDFYNLTGKKVLLYDPTLFGDQDIDKTYCIKLAKKCKLFSLCKYVLHIYRWKGLFEELRNYGIIFHNEGIACEAYKKYDTFRNHLLKNGISKERILLKIDIEGNEYSILNGPGFIEGLDLVDQIIIEFHNLKSRLRELESIVNELKKQFYIAHIHGNNYSEGFCLYRESSDIYFPDVVEITLVRKTKVSYGDMLVGELDYPIPDLDYPNSPFYKDFDRLVFS